MTWLKISERGLFRFVFGFLSHRCCLHAYESWSQHLDSYAGAKRRHLFFGLIRIFRLECMVMATVIVLRVVSTFSAPIGIYKLLQ